MSKSKLTVGDCVVILGKPWAEEHGIRTAEDMQRQAPPEWAAEAKRAVKAQKQKQGVSR